MITARDLMKCTAASSQPLTVKGLAAELECGERRIYFYLAESPIPLWLLEGFRAWYMRTGPLQPREIDRAFKQMLGRAWPRLVLTTRGPDTSNDSPPPRGGRPRPQLKDTQLAAVASQPDAPPVKEVSLPPALSPAASAQSADAAPASPEPVPALHITSWDEACVEYRRAVETHARAATAAVIEALCRLSQFAAYNTPRGRSALQRRLARATKRNEDGWDESQPVIGSRGYQARPQGGENIFAANRMRQAFEYRKNSAALREATGGSLIEEASCVHQLQAAPSPAPATAAGAVLRRAGFWGLTQAKVSGRLESGCLSPKSSGGGDE